MYNNLDSQSFHSKLNKVKKEKQTLQKIGKFQGDSAQQMIQVGSSIEKDLQSLTGRYFLFEVSQKDM